MKKRLLSFILCAVLLLPLIPAAAGTDIVQTDTFGGKTYNVLRGTYYCHSALGEVSGWQPFYYSDGYFEGSSSDYNPHLATMSVNLAVAAIHSSGGEYAMRQAPARQMLADIGCDEQGMYANEWQFKAAEENSMAVMMGRKKLQYADGTYTGYILVPITLRGGGYGLEWGGNLVTGASGEAEGFSKAADIVMEDVEYYINNYGLVVPAAEGKIKFWVTGYSRGGAAANIAAKRLSDKYGATAVYAYPGEAPMGGIAAEEKGDYSCIHNLINPADLVAALPPAAYGFKRYGKDESVVNMNNWDAMQRQLALFDPGYGYGQPFKLYTFKLDAIRFLLGTPPEISPIESYSFGTDYITTIANFNSKLVEKLVQWSIQSRDKYAAASMTLNGHSYPGYQEALKTVAVLAETVPNSCLEAAVGAATDNLKSVLDPKTLLSLYTDVLGGWSSLSEREKEKWIGTLWQAAVDTGALNELPQTAATDIERIWTPLACALLDFAATDNVTTGASLGYSGVKDKLILSCTLGSNLQTIIANHDYYVNLAWLRAADTYYSGEQNASKARASAVPEAPVCTVKGAPVSAQEQSPTVVPADGKLALDSTNTSGELIWYKLEGGAAAGEERFYQGEIELPPDTGSTVYKITAYALQDGNKGPTSVGYVKNDTACLISGEMMSDGIYFTASCSDSSRGKAYVAAAVFDGERMRQAVVSRLFELGQGDHSDKLDLKLKAGYKVRLFLVDANENTPMCRYWAS